MNQPDLNPKADVWSAAGTLLAQQNRAPRLTRLPDVQGARLSFAQERLWLLEQMEPGAPYYNVPLSWDIAGDLNVLALQRSLDSLVQRHEILRTSFPLKGSEPVQQINDWHPQLPVVDVSPAANPAKPAATDLSEFIRLPFDLANGPLLRARLYQRAPAEHCLVIVLHQMIFDGASLRLFCAELQKCYAAFCEAREPVLEPLRFRYIDFSEWQRRCLTGEELESADAFWAAQFEKPYEPLRFATDHPRSNSGITPGAKIPFVLDKTAADQLKRLAMDLGVTPFAALLAAFQAFLGRCAGQEDVLTLASIAARNPSPLRNVMGLIANILPLRLDLSGNPSFREVLQRASRTVSAALAHQTLPLSQILEKLPSSGSNVDTPALQALIVYNNAPLPVLEFPDVSFSTCLDLDNGTAKFDFIIDLSDSPQGVSGHLKYRSDLFEESTIRTFVRDWQHFIEKAVATPHQPLSFTASSKAATNGVRNGQVPVLALHAAPPAAPLLSAMPQINGKAAGVLPRTDLERKLARVWENVFNIRPIGIDDNFFGLGGHSLIAVKLLAAIEQETGQKLRLRTLFQDPTIARLAEAMERAETVGSSIVEIQPRGSKPPLFLVHGVGGGMFWGYNNLAHHLGSDQPVYGFKSRGMDGLEEFTKIEDMAAHYLADLRKVQPHGPYYLGGYCFGGNVAYEMARQLKEQGDQVGLLALMNCWPNNSSYTHLSFTPGFLIKAAKNFCIRLGHQIRWGAKQPREFFKWRSAWLRKRLFSRSSTKEEDRLAVEDVVDLSSRPEHERKLWRTHIQAWLHYQPQPYNGRIVLFRTRGHPLVCSFDHQMGWAAFARGGVVVKTCPGDHESLLEEENVAYAARALSEALDESVRPPRSFTPPDPGPCRFRFEDTASTPPTVGPLTLLAGK